MARLKTKLIPIRHSSSISHLIPIPYRSPVIHPIPYLSPIPHLVPILYHPPVLQTFTHYSPIHHLILNPYHSPTPHLIPIPYYITIPYTYHHHNRPPRPGFYGLGCGRKLYKGPPCPNYAQIDSFDENYPRKGDLSTID